MSDAKLTLIRKAPVEGIAVHVTRGGLSLGDPAWLEPLADGRIGVFARTNQRVLGLFSRWRPGFLGHLDPLTAEVVAPSLAHGDRLRVRIIDLVPEHLAKENGPEVYISVWGDPRHLQPILRLLAPAPEPDSWPDSWTEPGSRRRLSGIEMAR